MKFYICSVGEANKDYADENFERCIKYNGHFMHNSTTHKGVYDEVKKGDIVIMKFKEMLNAFGEVKKIENTDNEDLGDWNYAIYVNKWYFHNEKDKRKGIPRTGVQKATIAGDQYATIKQISEDFAIDKIAKIGGNDNELLIKIKKEKNENSAIKKMVDLLVTNHNLILTGAPGTGKTYLAKQIAKQLIFEKENLSDEEEKQFNEQCCFVQFHPSYDYTDFVEGLRPIQDDNGNVGFERTDGVFKEFCSKALETESDSQSNFEEAWSKLISNIRDNLAKGNLTKIGNWEYGLSTKNSLKYTSVNTPSKYTFTITKKNVFDTYCGSQARASGAFHNDMLKIVDYLKNEYRLSDYNSAETNKTQNKPFVFIIDEINRGEISKIFGELFFSIDPGYRGKNGKVRTQYANMQTDEPNNFDETLRITDSENFGHFFVPENVYIIGTMNDIDRSVESMDFAFRRRFAFKEITAKETQSMLESDDAWKIDGKSFKPDNVTVANIKNRMNNLNNKIWHKEKDGEKDDDKCIEGLSSAYHIGASYFLKLVNYRKDDNYDNESFEKLWNYHLEGLLREYLRGMQNVDEKINLLKAAYDNESDTNN